MPRTVIHREERQAIENGVRFQFQPQPVYRLEMAEIAMAKFARYELGKTEPLEIYEGDFMQCVGAYVKIFAGDEIIGDAQSLNPPHLQCAVRLSGGQRIAEIKAAPSPENPNAG